RHTRRCFTPLRSNCTPSRTPSRRTGTNTGSSRGYLRDIGELRRKLGSGSFFELNSPSSRHPSPALHFHYCSRPDDNSSVRDVMAEKVQRGQEAFLYPNRLPTSVYSFQTSSLSARRAARAAWAGR